MRQVRLLKNYGSNWTGEVCSFEEALARKLVKLGTAVFVDAPKPEAPAPAPVEPAAKEYETKPAEAPAKAVMEPRRKGGLFSKKE